MLDSAHNGILRYKGFLSAAEAHTQGVYDSLVGLTTPEEFEKIQALTTATGRLKYFPARLQGCSAVHRLAGEPDHEALRRLIFKSQNPC